MKAKIVYIKAQENTDNIESLHKCIKDLNDKVNLLCAFIQDKHELSEEEKLLEKVHVEDLKTDFEKPEKAVIAPKISKNRVQPFRVAGGILAVQQKGRIGRNGKRAPVRLVINRRRVVGQAQPIKKARRFRKK